MQDWVKLAVNRARATGTPADLLARREPRPRRADHREGEDVPRASTTPTGLDIRILAPAAALRSSRSSASQGPGHDLRHRQRAARLPHRPLPDPRSRHQREDALDRPADERRRPVRDRRRRLRAETRPAVRRGELPALGLPRRVLRPRRSPSSTSAITLQPREGQSPRRHARRRQRQVPRERQVPRAARSARIDNRGSHFYLALYWAQALAAQTKTPSWQRLFTPIADDARAPARRRSSTSSSPSKASPSTSAATTTPTTPWPRP